MEVDDALAQLRSNYDDPMAADFNPGSSLFSDPLFNPATFNPQIPVYPANTEFHRATLPTGTPLIPTTRTATTCWTTTVPTWPPTTGG
jgi:hypothetical protein